PILSQRRDSPDWRELVSRLSLFWRLPGAGLALIAAAGLFLIPDDRAPGLSAATPILLLLLAEWLLTLEAASMTAAVIANGRDRSMARAGAMLIGLGLVAQAALFPLVALPLLLTARIAIFFASVRLNHSFAGLSPLPGPAALLPILFTVVALTLTFSHLQTD
ncbi:MAG: hypothetical protein ACOVVK_16290, partial [Elsteraceae bacterium]